MNESRIRGAKNTFASRSTMRGRPPASPGALFMATHYQRISAWGLWHARKLGFVQTYPTTGLGHPRHTLGLPRFAFGFVCHDLPHRRRTHAVKKEILSKKLADHVIVGLALQGMPESAMLPAKTLGALFLESIYPQWRFCQHFKSIYDPFDIGAPTFEGE
jgi:hypothetical protein